MDRSTYANAVETASTSAANNVICIVELMRTNGMLCENENPMARLEVYDGRRIG